jgi:hypothetical protein
MGDSESENMLDTPFSIVQNVEKVSKRLRGNWNMFWRMSHVKEAHKQTEEPNKNTAYLEVYPK